MSAPAPRKRARATVIVRIDGALLLVADKSGLVLLPGGGVDAGELPIVAAARELHEETGLVAHALEFLFHHESPTNLHHVFYCQAEGIPVAADDAEALVWLRETGANALLNLSPATRSIIIRFEAWQQQALLPKVLAWAEACAEAAAGVALDEAGLRIARAVGVQAPERIRLVLCHKIPMPSDAELLQAAQATGLLGPATAGLTIGYSVFIQAAHFSAALLAHECRHVHQVEQAGGLAPFLAEYIRQVVEYGYRDAPLEIDARAWANVLLPPDT